MQQSGIGPGDLVLDIGAGDGALTGPLLDAGARVVAFELDPHRAATLRRRFAGPHLTVVQADVADLRLPRRPFRAVANPPFGLTTAILRRLLHPASRLERADLILPEWAANRWAAGRGAGGAASRATFRLRTGDRVPAAAFRPHPPAAARVLVASRASGRKVTKR